MDKAKTMISATRKVLVLSLAAVMFIITGCDFSGFGEGAPEEGMDGVPDSLRSMDLAPLVKGYSDGGELLFIHTEASAPQVANMLTEMMGPRVVLTPRLAETPEALLADIYVFKNGIEGMGPFGYQPDVFASVPGEEGYRPLWAIHFVSWNAGATPRVLRSEEAVQEAAAQGEITIEEPGFAINAPVLAWPGGHRGDPSDSDYAPGSLTRMELAPLVKGYYDGDGAFFIHTEASDPQVANMLTEMMGPKVVLVPELAQAPEALLADIYVFQNGVEGMGPFGYQPDVFASVPGDEAYSPLQSVHLVTWNEGATPRVLRSAEEVHEAAKRGEVTIKEPGIVINAPVLAWPEGHR